VIDTDGIATIADPVNRPEPPVPSGIATRVRCPECGRVFDLTDPTDADELASGHDCEA
jgi:hypothetical protein